ncbi:MAG: relaxase/mobilization nuclease domain-containing protein [Lachnospiraceae bacterium]|nr:relaxase/mobilization nuclease domain-containing protein [Lachnospiraceae bacterium]
MAVTVLKHLKESKKGIRSAHLKNSINYICNPAKTNDGELIYSNCGTDKNEIYESMIKTKEFYNKLWGRQGYHYVISLPPGEGSPELMYKVAKEFCEELIHDFDYVFAVHTDQKHCHAHIVFNSVNKFDGYKYRYNNGDWKKIIQPVTDALCDKYGLSTLEYEEEKPRIGKNYAEHMAQKDDRLTHADLIRMDIDAAVLEADDIEDYLKLLQKKGYTYRIGNSEKYGEYVSYHMPGAKKSKRDYSLGEGYSLKSIRSRIEKINKRFEEDSEKVNIDFPYEKLDSITHKYFPGDMISVYHMSGLSRYQVCMVRRIDQAVRHYDFDLIISEQARIRRDLLHIENLRDECNYLIDNNVSSRAELVKRLQAVATQIKEGRALPEEDWIAKKQELYQERRLVRRLLNEYEETINTRDLSPIRDLRKEIINGYKDNVKRNADARTVSSDIEGPLRDPVRYNG